MRYSAIALGLAATLVLFFPTSSFAGFYDGHFLKELCAKETALLYVAGTYDAFEIASMAAGSQLKICLPAGTGGKYLTDLVCTYVGELPDADLVSSAGLIAAAAMRSAHSCPGT